MPDIHIREPEVTDAEALSAYVAGLVAENTGTITLKKAPTPEEERVFIAKNAVAERAHVVQQEVRIRGVALLGKRRDRARSRTQAASVTAVATDRLKRTPNTQPPTPNVLLGSWELEVGN